MNIFRHLLRRVLGPSVPPAHRAAPAPSQLDALCARYACRYERSVFPTGEVQIMLIRDDATLSATGLSTADAVNAIEVKADKCWGAL